MDTSSSKISRSDVIKAIQRSGYLMEQRIIPIIEQLGYYVEANPVYPDPITNKSREYDFSALSAIKVYKEEFDFIFINIIGECVNNAQPLVFFLSNELMDFTFSDDIKLAGIPLYFPADDKHEEYVSFQDFFHFEKFHHYCHGKYSSQYCTFKKKTGKNQEWMAWHDEEHHQIFNSLIEATKYEVNNNFISWNPPLKNEEEPVNITLYYPLLIIHDDLYVCNQSDGDISLKKQSHIQFRKSIVSKNLQDTFQISVITESYLGDYLKMLEAESEQIKKRMQRNKREVKRSVDLIISKAVSEYRKKKIKNYREILEF